MNNLTRYIEIIERIDWLIKHKCTGSPKKLAKLLDISERRTYDYIKLLKNEFKAPIYYNHSDKSYEYKEGFVLKMESLLNN